MFWFHLLIVTSVPHSPDHCGFLVRLESPNFVFCKVVLSILCLPFASPKELQNQLDNFNKKVCRILNGIALTLQINLGTFDILKILSLMTCKQGISIYLVFKKFLSVMFCGFQCITLAHLFVRFISFSNFYTTVNDILNFNFILFLGSMRCAKLLQQCPTLCNPMDCSLPGSSVHKILQARVLEWIAVPSSRESSRPRD